MVVYLLSVMFALLSINPVAAQKILDPRIYSGVWDRSGAFDKSDYPFFVGKAVSTCWATVEPENGKFDFSEINRKAADALRDDQYFYMQVSAGPSSPPWIYNAGVPKVRTVGSSHLEKKNKWFGYPFYLDPDYEKYYFRMLERFAENYYSMPVEQQNRLAFIQVAVGCTGDECAYKGKAVEAKYTLPKDSEKWQNFRIKVFKKYIELFQHSQGRKVPLLFNAVSPKHPKAHVYVLKNVKFGFGIKGSVLPRGYHLTKQREFIEYYRPHAIDPEVHWFSRAEMDQTWNQPYFRLNIPMNFYWSILHAIHGGLNVYDVTKSAIIKNPKLKETIPCFYLFNRYAGDIYPEKAKSALIAFHLGLDASDTKRFPEDKFGKANPKNTDRMVAICKAYEKYGARMDDPEGAALGQVAQRKRQKGFNDAGWAIYPGNYERFITQIEPEKTSVGLFRIGGPLTSNSHKYSRFARAFEHESGKDRIYLDVNDKFSKNKGENGKRDQLSITVIYYDKGKGKFSIIYDALEQPEKTAAVIEKMDSKTWKEKTITISDWYFNNRGEKGADLILDSYDNEDDIFHLVEIRRM